MKLFWWWVCVMVVNGSFAQTPNDLNDQSAKAAKYTNISGHPYLKDEWSDGIIRFSSGRVMKQFKLKYDCVKNQLLLQFSGSTFVAESKVKEFVMFRKREAGKDSLVFRKGFPAIGTANEETFYEVLAEGKVFLLGQHTKNIIEEKQIASTTVYRRFEDQENFFLFRNGVMTRISNEKGSLVELLDDKSEELRKFISELQLKMRTANDFVKVVKKYNELLP